VKQRSPRSVAVFSPGVQRRSQYSPSQVVNRGENMRERYPEVTFHNGKPLVAYLYLPRATGVKSVRTTEATPGILVDFAANDAPIGLEIPAPTRVTGE
jgi:hypothetical protein